MALDDDDWDLSAEEFDSVEETRSATRQLRFHLFFFLLIVSFIPLGAPIFPCHEQLQQKQPAKPVSNSLPNKIYAWIGCNSAKFGHLYAAAPMRPNSTVGVTSILGGASDNTGSGIARRLVLKTGLEIILACNIPKNSPMLEADAEKLLVQKLINLGYTRPKSDGF